jgi:uncharacterized iron-regulated protein
MTDEQRAVLAMVVIDPDGWMQNAINVFGEEKATENLIAKVAKYQTQYDEAIANGTYKTRVQAQIDYENSPEYLAEQQAIADRLARQQAKMQSFIDNLPSWAVVGRKFDTMSAAAPTATNAQLKDILVELITTTKKLARVVYWLAKDTEK